MMSFFQIKLQPVTKYKLENNEIRIILIYLNYIIRKKKIFFNLIRIITELERGKK